MEGKKFWERMTAAQMGKLLREREDEDLKAGWDQLLKEMRENIGETPTIKHDKKELSSMPYTPAAYLFVCIAVICEQKDQLSFRDVDQLYLPDDLAGTKSIENCFTHIRHTEGETEAPDAKVAGCMARLRKDVKGFSQDMALGDLLDRVQQKAEDWWNNGEPQQDESGEGKVYWYSMEKGFQTLRACFDEWDSTCYNMWRTIRKKQLWENRQVREICDIIRQGVGQVILHGAPGTGKTYTAKLVAEYMGAELLDQKTEAPLWYKLVQFHPSYDYTDFVEGLRPVQFGEKELRFVKLDGSFKAFCRRVVEDGDPQKYYFFIIDEINRADLSKVFGELMYCLETDKRGEKVETQYHNLPTYRYHEADGTYEAMGKDDVFADGFYIPKNVVVIGTMNDIDRSVESMDFALRRRFIWREIQVSEVLLQAFRNGAFPQILRDNASLVAAKVEALNDVIFYDGNENRDGNQGMGNSLGLTRQHYISQGQFSGLKGDNLKDLLQFAWDYRIKDLLREYVRGENERVVDEFIEACKTAYDKEYT